MAQKGRSQKRKFVNPLNRQIGRRTGRNITAGKKIGVRDGFENFDDYLSESDADLTRDHHQLRNITEESSATGSSQDEGKENEISKANPAGKVNISVTQSMLSQNSQSTMDSMHVSKFGWLKNRNLGRRTGKDLTANKEIRVDAYGIENFDDYLSETDASSFFSQSSHFSSPMSVPRKRKSDAKVDPKALTLTEDEHGGNENSSDPREDTDDETQDTVKDEQTVVKPSDAHSQTIEPDNDDDVGGDDDDNHDDGDQEQDMEEETEEGHVDREEDKTFSSQDNTDNDDEEVTSDRHLQKVSTHHTDSVDEQSSVQQKANKTQERESDDVEENEEENSEIEDEVEEQPEQTSAEGHDANTEENLSEDSMETNDDVEAGEEVGEENSMEAIDGGTDDNAEADELSEIAEDEDEAEMDEVTPTATTDHVDEVAEEVSRRENNQNITEKSALEAKSPSGIDVAGSRSGSITKLEIKSQPTSTNFIRTKKRLSYSALELSEESQRSRRSRVEQANKELHNDNAKSANKSASESNKSEKPTGNTSIRSVVNHDHDETASNASASSFMCLASRAKLSASVHQHSDDEDICIVENTKTKSQAPTSRKKVKKNSSVNVEPSTLENQSVIQKGRKRPKSEMKSKQTLAKNKTRRKSIHSVSENKGTQRSLRRKLDTENDTNSHEDNLDKPDKSTVGSSRVLDMYDINLEDSEDDQCGEPGQSVQEITHGTGNKTKPKSKSTISKKKQEPKTSAKKQTQLSNKKNLKKEISSSDDVVDDDNDFKSTKKPDSKTKHNKSRHNVDIDTEPGDHNASHNLESLDITHQKSNSTLKGNKSIGNNQSSADITSDHADNALKSNKRTTRSKNKNMVNNNRKSMSQTSSEDDDHKRHSPNKSSTNISKKANSSLAKSVKQQSKTGVSKRKSSTEDEPLDSEGDNASPPVAKSTTRHSNKKVPKRKSSTEEEHSDTEVISPPTAKSIRRTKTNVSKRKSSTDEEHCDIEVISPETGKSSRRTKTNVSKRKSSTEEEHSDNEVISPQIGKYARRTKINVSKHKSSKEEEQGDKEVISPPIAKSKRLSKTNVLKRKSSTEDEPIDGEGGDVSHAKPTTWHKKKKLSKRKSSDESQTETDDKDVFEIEKKKLSKNKKSKSVSPVHQKASRKNSLSDDDNLVSDDLEDVDDMAGSPYVNNCATPQPDSVVKAPTNFGSGVSFRVSRRSELLENVSSGYVAPAHHVTVQVEASSGLTPILSRPGKSRKSKGRRVTICPEENVHFDISERESQDTPKIKPFRHSRGMSDTPLPSVNSTPMHLFETTTNTSPAGQDQETEGTNTCRLDKLIVPEPPPDGLRRSQRNRLQRLDWYKGERPVFDYTQKDGPVIIGVKPSLEELKWKKLWADKQRRRALLTQIRRASRAERRDKKPLKRLSIHTEIPGDVVVEESNHITIINPLTQEESAVECVCKGRSVGPVGPHHGSPQREDPYLITQTISQPLMSAGVLTIKPKAAKPTQFVSQLAVVFHVTYGKLIVKIHETKVLIETGDTFFVPIGNTYSLTNLRADTATLFYTIYKEPNQDDASSTNSQEESPT